MTEQWEKLWGNKWLKDPGNDGQLYGPEGYDQIAEFISELIGECASVLDVGCGTGEVIRRVPANRKTGLDIYVRQPCQAFDYVVGTAVELPFPDQSFTAAYIHGVTQFLSDSELIKCLDEIERVAVKVVVLDIPDNRLAEKLHAHRKRIRRTLPPHHTHDRSVFIRRGYSVSDVALPLTIGYQYKFNAVKV